MFLERRKGRCLMGVVIYIHTLWCGVQGITTQSPEVVGARLVDGSRASEGRVEVYNDGEWGTVCDNLWTIKEASVLCKQLGYIGADEVVIGGQFGQGSGQVFLDMVQCETGDEANLFECDHSDIGSTSCTHSEDVGVVCTSTGSLRLEDGTSYLNGRLEYLDITEVWGTVCNEGWDYIDEVVACKQLGFDDSSTSTEFIASPGTGSIVLGGIQCDLSDERLDSCDVETMWTPGSCTHDQDVGLECMSRFRIDAPSEDSNEFDYGIPAVYYGRTWGSFCPDNWNINAARVFCINAGFEDALFVDFQNADSENPPNIILNTIDCSGEEDDFKDCPHVEWAYQADCNLNEVPLVQCQSGIKDIFELITEPPSEDFPASGRVEVNVYPYSESVTICNRTWTQEAADVVCREIGFPAGAVRSYTIAGGSGDRVFDNIHCTGNEEKFDDCRSELVEISPECNHIHDVGVECLEGSIINLVSGTGSHDGVVSYQEMNRRALICDATWTDTEAAVVCKMAGYEDGATSTDVDLGPEDIIDVFQWDIACRGDEERLEDCTVTKLDNPTTCAPENIAQVQCSPLSEGNFRLVGSDEAEQGRLEYFTGNEWLSVWVNKTRPPTEPQNLYDGLCKIMGYEREVYHYNDDEETPFESVSEGARFLCNEQCGAFPNTTTDFQPLGIVCKPFEMVAYHPIRLVDRETNEISTETGVVEIYNDGEWGNVCQNEGNFYSYDKLCSELGFEDTSEAMYLQDGEGTSSKKWFSVVPGPLSASCIKLYECPHTAWGHPMDECIPLAVSCVGGTGGSGPAFGSLASSLIIMVVIIVVDVVLV